jgi:hypothetical protein
LFSVAAGTAGDAGSKLISGLSVLYFQRDISPADCERHPPVTASQHVMASLSRAGTNTFRASFSMKALASRE